MTRYKYVAQGGHLRRVLNNINYTPSTDSIRFNNGQLHASTAAAQHNLVNAAIKRQRRQIKKVLERKRAEQHAKLPQANLTN